MSYSKKIKVCGMRQADNIAALDALRVDMMGFIFYHKSPRYVESKPAAMPKSAQRVGVFVNETIDKIFETAQLFELDYIQLHGGESAHTARTIAQNGLKVIKAFSVDESFDFSVCESYATSCEIFIFDTACSGHGGSGEQFDWSLLNSYKGATPFLLSGGISKDSAPALREFEHPALAGYDLNSRFESSPAVKNIELLKDFLEQLK